MVSSPRSVNPSNPVQSNAPSSARLTAKPGILFWRGVICLMLSSAAGGIGVGESSLQIAPAQAQTAKSEAPATPSRPAIAVTSAEDTVQKFNADNQLYVKG